MDEAVKDIFYIKIGGLYVTAIDSKEKYGNTEVQSMTLGQFEAAKEFYDPGQVKKLANAVNGTVHIKTQRLLRLSGQFLGGLSQYRFKEAEFAKNYSFEAGVFPIKADQMEDI